MRRRFRARHGRARLYGAHVTYTFPTRSDAWAFMRAADESDFAAGFPSLRAPYTVQTKDDHRGKELDALAARFGGRA